MSARRATPRKTAADNPAAGRSSAGPEPLPLPADGGSIGVIEEGRPQLEGGADTGLEIPAPDATAGGMDAPAAAPGWTPAAAARFVCAIWNVGAIVYGKAWIARPAEAADFSYQAADLLDRFLPVGTGGPMELIVNATVVAGGLVEMGMKREEVIAAGPRWKRQQREPGKVIAGPWPPQPGYQGGAGGAAMPPPAAAAPADSPGGAEYRLPADLVAAATPPPTPTMSGFGYQI